LPIPPCAARRLKVLQGILLRRAVHLPPLIAIQASGWTVSPVRHSFRWPGAIDVGGGHGVLLTLIRDRHPDLSGVLFDAPDVIANRDETFDRLVTAGQATRVSGDYFQSVPAEGDDANDRQRPPTTARRIAFSHFWKLAPWDSASRLATRHRQNDARISVSDPQEEGPT